MGFRARDVGPHRGARRGAAAGAGAVSNSHDQRVPRRRVALHGQHRVARPGLQHVRVHGHAF